MRELSGERDLVLHYPHSRRYEAPLGMPLAVEHDALDRIAVTQQRGKFPVLGDQASPAPDPRQVPNP